MPSKIVNKFTAGPYHSLGRCINREWFNIPMERVWEIFSEQLYFLSYAFQFKIHNFVLMTNHYHLILSTPNLNLSEGMAYFLRETSRQLNRDGNRINRTFAGRYRPCHLHSMHYFLNSYKYVYQNPVRAGITKRVEDYPFSTIHGLLGQSHLLIPVQNDPLLFEGDLIKNLEWLNCIPRKEDAESLRLALKSGHFRLPRERKTGNLNRLESELL